MGTPRRGPESLEEVRRQDGTQKSAYSYFTGLPVLKSFKIVTANDTLQSDLMNDDDDDNMEC